MKYEDYCEFEKYAVVEGTEIGDEHCYEFGTPKASEE